MNTEAEEDRKTVLGESGGRVTWLNIEIIVEADQQEGNIPIT